MQAVFYVLTRMERSAIRDPLWEARSGILLSMESPPERAASPGLRCRFIRVTGRLLFGNAFQSAQQDRQEQGEHREA